MMDIDSLQEFKLLVEHSSDLITVVDESGEIRYQSPSTQRILGYESNETVGTNSFEYHHPDDSQTVIEAFENIIESPGETTGRVEYRLRHKDGSWVWVESVATNRLDTVLGGYIINSREISARKQYEQRLEEMNEELEALNRVVRHDIRNDVSIILGWAEMLEDHVDSDASRYLSNIQDASEQIIELTEISRDYIETLTTERATELQPISLNRVVSNEIKLRKEAYPNAEIHLPEETSDIEVKANELLSSVFKNLINNAIQHNDSDTPVVDITFETIGDAVRVGIADNGPGVPDSRKELIFGKGEKGIESPGTGMGLYLVQAIVSSYSGSVWVEDNTPTGAVFYIEIPVVH